MHTLARTFLSSCRISPHRSGPPLALLGALLFSALLLGACDSQPAPESSEAPPPANSDRQAVTDQVVGVSLSAPAGWTKYPDEFTEEGVYGFVMAESPVEEAGGDETVKEGRIHARPQLRVALVQGATPEEIDELAQAKLDEYPEGYGPKSNLKLEKSDVEINGHQGVAVSGIPAALEEQYTVAFVGVGDRVYKVGVWRGLDAEAKRRFDTVEFQEPARSVASLNIPTQTAYLEKMGLPAEGEQVELNMERTGGERLEMSKLWNAEKLKAALGSGDEAETSAVANGCAVQPYSLYWQTQWINDTRRYNRGWSRLLSYRNRGRSSFHKGCWGSYKQYYAMDFGLQYGSKTYSAIPGRVKHAGRSNAGSLWTCGIFVDVVRNVNGVRYANRSCHLNGLNVSRGYYITPANLPYVVIGWTGLTGQTSTPHLHTAMFKYAKVARAGHVYGGTSVKPRSVRCYACPDYDTAYANGSGGWYNYFSVWNYYKY